VRVDASSTTKLFASEAGINGFKLRRLSNWNSATPTNRITWTKIMIRDAATYVAHPGIAQSVPNLIATTVIKPNIARPPRKHAAKIVRMSTISVYTEIALRP
jgi:hypothetical protein